MVLTILFSLILLAHEKPIEQSFFGRSYGGVDASRKQWPWMVHIQYHDKNNLNEVKLCGGAIINSRWVLTAAHCVKNIELNDCPDCIRAYVGLYDFRSHYSLEAHRSVLTIKRIIMHESFNRDNLEHDIALLEVGDLQGQPLDLDKSAYVRNICLPEGEVTPIGTKCYLAGWGYTEQGEASRYLREVDLDVQDIDSCIDIYSNVDLVSKLHPTQNICAGEKGKDACNGDSGGPLMCQRCDSCNWYVAGIVSFGKNCGVYPGVYTNVVAYETWIRQTTKMAALTTKRMRGCKDCCKYLKLSGTEKQQSRHGYYEKQDLDYNSQSTYKQMFTGGITNFIWFLGGKYSLWFVSLGLGDQQNGGMLTKTQTRCPSESKSWLVYDKEESQPWVDAPDLKIECLSEKPTPQYTQWESWTACSKKCEGGVKSRKRSCEYAFDASECRGESEQEVPCNEIPCGWSTWEEWVEDVQCTVGCGPGGFKRRTRSCPVDTCEGESSEEVECKTVDCPSDTCCRTMTYTNEIEPKFNGTYHMLRELHGGLPAWTNKEQSFFIYFTPDYNLWITNPTRKNSEARSYASSSSSSSCPAEYESWMYYAGGDWIKSNTQIQCEAEWTEWSTCDCKKRVSVRSKAKEVETKKCTCATDNFEWNEWSVCELKGIYCTETSRRSRERACSPDCDSMEASEMIESEVCTPEGCTSECCNEIVIDAPDNVEVSKSFLVQYKMRASTESKYPLYEGITDDGGKRYIYFYEKYKMWVASLKLDATDAAFYKNNNPICPTYNTKQNWRYLNNAKSWVDGNEMKLVCVTPATTMLTTNTTPTTTTAETSTPETKTSTAASPKTTSLPEAVTTKSTSLAPPADTYSPWTEWSTDCGNVLCGDWVNTRERACERVKVCKDTVEKRKCVATEFSTDSRATKATLTNMVPVECPSECCSVIRVTIPTVVDGVNKQIYRNGLYYQRLEMVDGRPSYTNNDNSYLYWVASWKAWIINNDLEPKEAALYTFSKESCPNLTSKWSVFEGDSTKWVKRDDVVLTCIQAPAEVKFEVTVETTTQTTNGGPRVTTTLTSTTTTTTTTTTALTWSEWTECSASCDGIRIRYKGEDQFGNRQQENCGGRCPYWASWEDWSQCDKSCGGGAKQRQRYCLSGPNKKTEGCHGKSIEHDQCNTEECFTFPCCQYVTIKTSSKTFEYRTGLYKIVNEIVDDRYIYKQEYGASIIFSTRKNYWLIGDDATKESGNAYAKGSDKCPTESNGWNEWDGTEWDKFDDFSIECGSDWTDWSLCSVTCNGGTRTRDRYTAQGAMERESDPCSTNECTECTFENENENCEQWADQGYCSTKFVKYMQKKCPQSCCQRGEYQPPRAQEERTFLLCDSIKNIFNDDFTPPPLNEWDEMLANEVTCDNYFEIKQLWQMELASRSVQLKSNDDPGQHLNSRMAVTAQDHLNIGVAGAV